MTPETATEMLADLSIELRRSLQEVWLPILPRSALRALLRDPERKKPSPLTIPYRPVYIGRRQGNCCKIFRVTLPRSLIL